MSAVHRLACPPMACAMVLFTLIAMGQFGPPVTIAQARALWLVSHAPAGRSGSADSSAASISGDGRWVAFASDAADLVADDTNGVTDVFLFDRQDETVRRVSLAAGGSEPAKRSLMPALSADGRWLAFRSDAALTADNAPWGGLYLRDLATGTVALIVADEDAGRGTSVFPAISGDGGRVAFESTAGLGTGSGAGQSAVFAWERATRQVGRVSPADANAEARDVAISDDGSTVAYISTATNLVPGPAGSGTQVYVVTLAAGTLERVSVASGGTSGNDVSTEPALSGDGRLVAFTSLATNLVAKDVNLVSDIFVHDRATGQTVAVTDVVPDDNVNHPGHSADPVFSADGRWLAFASAMYTLTPDDRNWTWDVYVRDQVAGATRRVSQTESGGESDRPSWAPALAAAGGFVAFSASGPLVGLDTGDNDDIYLRDLSAALSGHPHATATAHDPTASPTSDATHHPPTGTATPGHDHPTATAPHHPPTATATPGHEHATATPTVEVTHHPPTGTATPGHDHATATPTVEVTHHPPHPTATSPHHPAVGGVASGRWAYFPLVLGQESMER